jgi:hypothetical protein
LIKDYKIPLLFKTGTPQNATLWYVHDNPICDVCKGFFNGEFNAAFIVDWTKEGVNSHLIHMGCVSKWKKHPLSVTQDRLKILLSEKIPPKCTPVIMTSPAFTPSRSNVTVFEPDKLHSDRETDNAWRSKRYPSLESATIGKPLLEEKSEEDVLLMLEGEVKK